MIILSKDDQERLNHTAYAYRMARPEKPQEVVDRYNDLVDLIRDLIENATDKIVLLE